jgi:CBS domain-containing membrane protein
MPDADALGGALRASFAELQAAVAVRIPASQPTRPAVPAGPATVATLMSQPVLAVSPDDSLATAWLTMRRARIRHLPVQTTDCRLVGLLTHRDILGAASSRLVVPSEPDRVRQLTGVRVGDVMETHVQTAAPDEPAGQAGQRLLRGKIGCLPVVDGDGRLVGIVTGADFLRWAAVHLDGTHAAIEAA